MPMRVRTRMHVRACTYTHTPCVHACFCVQEHHLVVDLVVDKHAGMPHCFGADVLDQHTLTMTR
jgi:hypothetical protein